MMISFFVFLALSIIPPRSEATIIEIPDTWDPNENYIVKESEIQNKYVIFSGSFVTVEIHANNLHMQGIVVENNLNLEFVGENPTYEFKFLVCRNEITFSSDKVNLIVSQDLEVQYDFYKIFENSLINHKINLGVELSSNHTTLNFYNDCIEIVRPSFQTINFTYSNFRKIKLYIDSQMTELLPYSDVLSNMPDICFTNPEISYAYIPIIWVDNKTRLEDTNNKCTITKENKFTEISFESDDLINSIFIIDTKQIQCSTEIHHGVYHIVEDGVGLLDYPDTVYYKEKLEKSIYPYKNNLELIVFGFNKTVLTLDTLSFKDLTLTIRSLTNDVFNLNLKNLNCKILRISMSNCQISKSDIQKLTIPDTTNLTISVDSDIVKFDFLALYGKINTNGKKIFVNQLVTNNYVYETAMSLLQTNPNLDLSLMLLDEDHLPLNIEFYEDNIKFEFYKSDNLTIPFNLFSILKLDIMNIPNKFQIDFNYMADKKAVFNRNFVFTGHSKTDFSFLMPLNWKNISPNGLSISLQSENNAYYKTIEDYSIPDGIFSFLNVYYKGSCSGKYCILKDRVKESSLCILEDRQMIYDGVMYKEEFWTTPEVLDDDITVTIATDFVNISTTTMNNMDIHFSSKGKNLSIFYEDDKKPIDLHFFNMNVTFISSDKNIVIRDLEVKSEVNFEMKNDCKLYVTEKVNCETQNYPNLCKCLNISHTAFLTMYFVGIEESLVAHLDHIYLQTAEKFQDISVMWNDFSHIHFHIGPFFDKPEYPFEIKFEYPHKSMIENMFEIYGGNTINYIKFPSITGQENYKPSKEKGKFTSLFPNSFFCFQTYSGFIPNTIFDFLIPYNISYHRNASYCLYKNDFSHCPSFQLMYNYHDGEVIEFDKLSENYFESIELYIEGSTEKSPCILGKSFAQFSIKFEACWEAVPVVYLNFPVVKRISSVKVSIQLMKNATVEYLFLGFLSRLYGEGNYTGNFYVQKEALNDAVKLCHFTSHIYFDINEYDVDRINKIIVYNDYFTLGNYVINRSHGKNFYIRITEPNKLVSSMTIDVNLTNSDTYIKYFPNFKFEINETFYLIFGDSWNDKTFTSPYKFDIIPPRGLKVFVCSNTKNLPDIFNIPEMIFKGKDVKKIALFSGNENKCPETFTYAKQSTFATLEIAEEDVLVLVSYSYWENPLTLYQSIEGKNLHLFACNEGREAEYISLNFTSLKSLEIEGFCNLWIGFDNSKTDKLIMKDDKINMKMCNNLEASEFDFSSNCLKYFSGIKLKQNSVMNLRLINPLNGVKLSYGFFTISTNASEYFRFDYQYFSNVTIRAIATHISLDYNGTQTQTVPYLPTVILDQSEINTYVRFTDRWNIYQVISEKLGVIKKPPSNSVTYYSEYYDYPKLSWDISNIVVHRKRLGFYCLMNNKNTSDGCPVYSAQIDVTKMDPSFEKLSCDENNVVKFWSTAPIVKLDRRFFRYYVSLHGSNSDRGNYEIMDGDEPGGNRITLKNCDVYITGKTLSCSELSLSNIQINKGSSSFLVNGMLSGQFTDIVNIQPYIISSSSCLIDFCPHEIVFYKNKIFVNDRTTSSDLQLNNLGQLSFRSLNSPYSVMRNEEEYDYSYDLLTVGDSQIFLDSSIYYYQSKKEKPQIRHIFGNLVLISSMLEPPKTLVIPIPSTTVIYRFIPPRTPLFTLQPTYVQTPHRTPPKTPVPVKPSKFKPIAFVLGIGMFIDLVGFIYLSVWLRKQWVLSGLSNMRPLVLSASIELETSAKTPEGLAASLV